jgi:hypothetical protein
LSPWTLEVIRKGRLMLAFDGDLVRSSRSSAAAVRRRLNRGELREITRGLYTRNRSDPLERVVLDNQVRILGMYYSEAVITDRGSPRRWISRA